MKKNNSSNGSTFNKASKGGESTAAEVTDVSKSEPVIAEPLQVMVHGNFEKAIRTFRALVQKERILSIYKEKQTYEKPSDRKRRKKNEAKRKLEELDRAEEIVISPKRKRKHSNESSDE